MSLLRSLTKIGWPNVAFFLAAVVAGLWGIVAPPPWVPLDRLAVGLLTLIVVMVYLLFSRVVTGVEEKLETFGETSLDSELVPRSERIRSGGIVAFEDLRRAGTEVFVVGVSCINFLAQNEADLREALEAGARMRFVLVDPAVEFLGLYDVNMENQSDADEIRDDIRHAIARIDRLSTSGSISYRLYPGVPMFSAVWVKNPRRTFIFVEF